MLLELGLFLLGMGFTEVVVKPIVRSLFRNALLRVLPGVFDRLDPIMPESILHLTPAQLEKRVMDAISGVAREEGMTLSQPEREKLFSEFVARYNPVIAASKCKS